MTLGPGHGNVKKLDTCIIKIVFKKVNWIISDLEFGFLSLARNAHLDQIWEFQIGLKITILMSDCSTLHFFLMELVSGWL